MLQTRVDSWVCISYTKEMKEVIEEPSPKCYGFSMTTLRNPLRYRQIHLDFHTSPLIPGIGERFDKARWQDCLSAAAVDSVTLFSKCHHGVSYHPTEVGRMHPGLKFDLLAAQYEALKEIGINAPIYLSAGVDNVASDRHPEWREIDPDGSFTGWAKSPLQSGYHMMDFHSPYLDYLCAQIEEVVRLFPDCDGIFLDIIHQRGGCGRWSLEYMSENGLDAKSEADRRESCRLALEKYYEATTAAARSGRADMPVFHNGGHIPRGQNQLLKYFSHLELESLPTGGWGYDHFPMSAKYVCNLGLDFLGMTGKFHTTWGEVGGYKHPNALRYECAAMLAYGARCSVGDQLHPSAELDASTYGIIGQAYREVAAKEDGGHGAQQAFDIGVLSSEAENAGFRDNPSDEGANRILLEGHFLFGLVDRTMDFGRFKLLILPDDIRIDEALKAKLDAFLAAGGKLLLSGESGLWKGREEMAFHIGADYEGLSPVAPPDDEPNRGHDYVFPVEALRADFVETPQIMYARSHRIRVGDGESLGDVYDPYFPRDWKHFSGHQHTPNQIEPSGYACGVRKGGVVYLSHPVFRHYRQFGAVAYREFVVRTIHSLLGEEIRLTTNLPSTARVTLTHQPGENRHILHLLYAPTVSRGGPLHLSGGNLSAGRSVEVIEDLPELLDTTVTLRGFADAVEVRGFDESMSLTSKRVGKDLVLGVGRFACHAMVALRQEEE